jgi:hypothetical protein
MPFSPRFLINTIGIQRLVVCERSLRCGAREVVGGPGESLHMRLKLGAAACQLWM